MRINVRFLPSEGGKPVDIIEKSGFARSASHFKGLALRHASMSNKRARTGTHKTYATGMRRRESTADLPYWRRVPLFSSAAQNKKLFEGWRRERAGTPMTTIQSIMLGIMLYLTPSVLLAALLLCREELNAEPDESELDHSALGRRS
jgi:hypothetical protein